MKLGSHQTEEARAKMSVAHKGYIASTETRAKLSAIGKGHEVSPETRAKISAANSNPSSEVRAHMSAAKSNQSAETRAKISAANKGKHRSSEARANISAAASNPSLETRAKMSAAHWKGGLQVSKRREKAKRRTLGFCPINEPFPGCEGHHTDKDHVVYIPSKLHHSVYHNQWTGRGMAEINALAFAWLSMNDAVQ